MLCYLGIAVSRFGGGAGGGGLGVLNKNGFSDKFWSMFHAFTY